VKQPRVRDPLGPLDLVTSFFAAMLALAIATTVVAAMFGSGVSTLGIGDDSVCVTTDLSTFGLTEDPYGDVRQDEGIRRGVTINADGANLCDPNPGLREKVLNVLVAAPSTIVFFGFVLLTRRIIKYARRHGLFSGELARRITHLGWLLLGGLLLAGFLKWLGEGLLLASMVDSMSWTAGWFSVSVPALIGSVGVISIGRIMSHAAALQADADATI
jgi:hypothetical protein